MAKDIELSLDCSDKCESYICGGAAFGHLLVRLTDRGGKVKIYAAHHWCKSRHAGNEVSQKRRRWGDIGVGIFCSRLGSGG
jgi:hypothetical protein